jgi:hypothetical protein
MQRHVVYRMAFTNVAFAKWKKETSSTVPLDHARYSDDTIRTMTDMSVQSCSCSIKLKMQRHVVYKMAFTRISFAKWKKETSSTIPLDHARYSGDTIRTMPDFSHVSALGHRRLRSQRYASSR